MIVHCKEKSIDILLNFVELLFQLAVVEVEAREKEIIIVQFFLTDLC